jgi:hypothetical protein
VSARKPTLPLSWYFTPAELAHDWGVHPDRIMYYCDAGLIEPAVLVPKTGLPVDCPGPASHLCVLLPDYRSMAWSVANGECVAPLVGEYRAFQIDGQEFRNLTLRDCDQVLVSRADLVIPLEQREAVEAMGAMIKSINPTERSTLLYLLALAARAAYPNLITKPYAVAEKMSRDLALDGVTLGRQAIANKLLAAQEVLAVAERQAA